METETMTIDIECLDEKVMPCPHCAHTRVFGTISLTNIYIDDVQSFEYILHCHLCGSMTKGLGKTIQEAKDNSFEIWNMRKEKKK